MIMYRKREAAPCSLNGAVTASLKLEQNYFLTQFILQTHCQFILQFLLFLFVCQASASSVIFFMVDICLFKHWPFNTCNSISAILSQLPCLGVYINSNLSHNLFATSGSKVS